MTVTEVFILLSLLIPPSLSCPKECVCDHRSKAVDCRGRGLYDIPRRLQPDTLELYLQDNRIRGLGSVVLRDTPLLRVLDLSNNSITSVSPSALLGLRALQRLSLANNTLRELDRRLLGPIRFLTHLDLSHNSLGGLPGALGESLRNVSWLDLAHNRLQRLERPLLDGLGRLEGLSLRGNPWRCDCQLIALKLWLESFLFRGGVVDEVLCSHPEGMRDRDLRSVPYQLFHACLTTSYSFLFANIHHLEAPPPPGHAPNHAGPAPYHPHGGTLGTGEGGVVATVVGGGGVGVGGVGVAGLPECEPKQRPRPVNLRHALATVVVTGVVCGVVCLMMLAAAVYGCAYAAVMARYQRELKKEEERERAAAEGEGGGGGGGGEKEPLENAIA